MAFITFCDQNDEMEAVLFPEMYIHFSDKLQEGAIVLVDGTIELRNHKSAMDCKWTISARGNGCL